MITFAIIFVIGIVMLVILPKVKNPPIRHVFSLFAVAGGLAGSLFFIVVSMIYLNFVGIYRGLQDAYDQGIYQIAEGVVRVSHVQPAGCNETGDLIQIDHVEFEINDCHGAPFGYSQTIENNGVLTDGTYVRVYYTEGKTILRVDVKR